MQVEHFDSVLGEVIFTSYDGDYDEENGEYNGPGTVRLDNGCIYEGDFLNGLFHGKGKFTWSDNVSYEGDFKFNKLTGSGVYTYPDGSVYTGQVFEGKRQGNGKLVNSGAQVYDGEWRDGKRNGVGKMIYNEDQTLHYTGEWKDNLRCGYGYMKYPSGNTFEGQWDNDQKNGLGVMIWRDVDELYSGYWLNDKPHGYGEHIWGDTTAKTIKKQHCNMYRGYFNQSKREGKGTFFYMNGSQYTGEWKYDQKDGIGIFIYPDGKIVAGKYEANHLVGCIDQSIINMKATEDISTQYFLHITEMLYMYPVLQYPVVVPPKSFASTGGKTIENHVNAALISTAKFTIPPSKVPASTATVPVSVDTSTEIASSSEEIVPTTSSPAQDELQTYLHHQTQNLTKLTQDIERLVLKYHQYTKTLLRRYHEITNRNRTRDIPFVPALPSSSAIPKGDLMDAYNVSKIQRAITAARNLPKRFHCSSLDNMYRCLAELSLVGIYINHYDIDTLLRQMKEEMMTYSMQQYGKYIEHLYFPEIDQEAGGTNGAEGGIIEGVNESKKEPGTEEAAYDHHQQQLQQQRRALAADEDDNQSLSSSISELIESAHLSIGQLDDAYQQQLQSLLPSLSPVSSAATLPIDLTTSSEKLTPGEGMERASRVVEQLKGVTTTPLLEHECVELILRTIGLWYVRQIACQPVELVWNYYQVVEYVMAKKVVPLATVNDVDRTLPTFLVEFYDTCVQDVLFSRPNVSQDSHAGKFYHIFQTLRQQEKNTTDGDDVITLQTFLHWVMTLKASGHVEGTVTDDHILHCLFGMTYPPVDVENGTTNDAAQGETKGNEVNDAVEVSSPTASSPKGRSSPPKVGTLSNTTLNASSNPRKSTFPPMPTTLSKELIEQLLYKVLNYVDFLHYLCRVVGSVYWIHGTGGDDNTRPNEPVIGVITTQVSSSTLVTETTMANGQVLKKKLVAWLQELPAFGISFALNN